MIKINNTGGINSSASIQSSVSEMEDRIFRKKNLMIFNLLGSTSPVKQDRLNHDQASISQLLNYTQAQDAVACINSINIIRTGKYIPNSKPRPLKVTFTNEYLCSNVLQLLWKLKSHQDFKEPLQNLVFSHDKTKIQQLNYQKAKQHLRERLTKGETNLCIREIRGEYLVKVKKIPKDTTLTAAQDTSVMEN